MKDKDPIYFLKDIENSLLKRKLNFTTKGEQNG